jgi:hypothetical protein
MPAPVLQDPSATWGVLEFVAPDVVNADAFAVEAMSEFDLGNPQPVVEVLKSLLIDGSLAVVTGWDNREIPIRLRLSANDGEQLAKAEAALFQQCQLDQPPPLVWTSPVGSSAATVFDTVVAVLERDNSEGWDLEEILRGYRYYKLTLTCLPFARAVESTVVPALPVPVDPEAEDFHLVDDCDSTTGWTRETNGGSPSGPTVGGAGDVYVEATINAPSDYLRLIRTGTIAAPTGYYLVADVAWDAGVGNDFITGAWRAYYNGTWHSPTSVAAGIGEGGSTRLFFEDVGTIGSVKIAFDFATVTGSYDVIVQVYRVAYTDTIGSATTTTNRQQSRLVTVSGSAPTQAQLSLYDGTTIPPDPLGKDILVYTTRSTGFTPNLRQWISTSEAPTGDTAMVSGARHTLDTPTVYLIPASLLTSGTYALLARIILDDDATISWQARMVTLDGADTVGSSVVISGSVDLAATGSPFSDAYFDVLDIGAMVLPVVDVSGSDYAVELTISGPGGGLAWLDEAWLFSLDDGVLTWIRDTESLTNIEIRSPELGAARPSVWGGVGDPGVAMSCIDWKCLSFGAHRFDPGDMQIFTVTTSSLVAQCQIEYFPRFHSNVLGEATS